MTIHFASPVCRCLLVKSVIAVVGLFAGHPARAAEKADSVIEVTAGKEFTISLDSNRSTGFGWQLAKPLDKTIVKSVKNDYQDVPRDPDNPIVGSPGKEVWTFKALKSGKTTIEFKYVRAWEKDKAPEKTKSIPVVVKAGK
jgi:inhibitor of cysteine peptidase